MDDRTALVDLVSRLGRALDTHDFGALRALYTDDAEVQTPGGTSVGIDAVVAQAAARHGDRTVWHAASNHVVEVAGDAATVEATLLAVFSDGPRDPAPFVVGEACSWEARRTADGWRLTQMSAAPAWTLHSPVPVG